MYSVHNYFFYTEKYVKKETKRCETVMLWTLIGICEIGQTICQTLSNLLFVS